MTDMMYELLTIYIEALEVQWSQRQRTVGTGNWKLGKPEKKAETLMISTLPVNCSSVILTVSNLIRSQLGGKLEMWRNGILMTTEVH